MTVERICHLDVDTARPHETALTAAERMHERTVGALVITDESNVPIGILTDRDLVVRVMAAGRDPDATTIREVMTPWPKTVLSTTPIESVLPLMQSGAFRRVPIVDEQGQLAGIVTLDDLLVLFCEEFGQIGGLLERETPQAAAIPISKVR